VVLTDDIVVEFSEKLLGLGNREVGWGDFLLFVELFFEDAFANVDAPIADVDAGTGDQLFDFCVTFTAEGTHREIGSSGHVGGGRFGFR
jgi:hypothetical protein